MRRLLDSGEIDYFRDEEQVFRIRLDSVLEYASRARISIDEEYYVSLTRRFTATIRNSGITISSQQPENVSEADEDYIPYGKSLWKTGVALAERFRNRKFLNALYKDERLADMMFRYFSGETLEQIGGVYDLTRERVRQLCKKGINRLMHHLSYYTKDVIEMKVDKDSEASSNSEPKQGSGIVQINGMRLTKRARNILEKQGVNSVEQLQRLSRSELMKFPGLGRKTLLEIVRVLEFAEIPDSPQKAIQLRPWTEEDIEQVVSLKRSGMSFQAIAEKVDRFTSDVHDQYYIRMRERRSNETSTSPVVIDGTEKKDPVLKEPFIWSEDEVTQLISLRSQGKTIRDIAMQLHRERREVSSKMEELGLKIRYRNLADLADEEKDGLVNRFHQDMSMADIAEEQQLKQVDLAQLLIEKGELPERNARTGQPWSSDELDALRTYVERDYPIGEIGYRLGRDYREITSKIYELVKAIR